MGRRGEVVVGWGGGVRWWWEHEIWGKGEVVGEWSWGCLTSCCTCVCTRISYSHLRFVLGMNSAGDYSPT